MSRDRLATLASGRALTGRTPDDCDVRAFWAPAISAWVLETADGREHYPSPAALLAAFERLTSAP